jgi:mannonate dehydratase
LNTTPQELADRYAKQSNGIALPGWEPERLVHINKTIEWYTHISQEQYWQNVAYFINRIIPWAEKLDIKMAIHPDDPPWPIFALPRLINNYENIKRFLDINPSVYHGITLCTGSIGVDANNDLIKIIQKFGNRIHFAHVRNLKFLNNGDFYETSHPSSCGSFDMYEIMKALYKSAPNIYIRPDHGRMIWNETGRPGYGLYDRALGITYLYGLWEAISKRDKEK